MTLTLAPSLAFAEEGAASGKATADDSTLTTWEGHAKDNTANIGRIWTDKSVSTDSFTLSGDVEGGAGVTINKTDGSDFLVGLSALSSTSSLNAVSGSQKPLDIVLVLDMSGSMDDRMTSYTYEEAYNVDTRRSYYILVDGEYESVEYNSGWFGQQKGWYYEVSSGWGTEKVYVTPKTSASDADDGHVQFYTRTSDTETKISALKNAVQNFIDSTDEQNADLGDNMKSRISLVKFGSDSSNEIGDDKNRQGYNYSQVVSDFTTNMNSLQNTVRDLDAAGATSADYGMEHAQRLLNGDRQYGLDGAREDAEKVVIFFTDGEPNHWDGFDGDVANSAIQSAKDLKDGGTSVYTIGIFSGADAESLESNTNRYMHAMSSNYPNATGYRTNNMGERAADSEFYFAAADAEQLNKVFEDIFDQIQTEAQYPTQTGGTGGYDATKSGYITFTDTLGAYMEVKGFNDLVYGGQTFKATDNGNGTWTYNGQVNGGIYPDADLSDIIVEVKKSDNYAQQGDTVTVKIPASVIPLRNFHIDGENGTYKGSVNEAYPMRVFYSVGLVDSVDMSDPDTYVGAQVENGAANFYSNLWDGESVYGNTTAEFQPAATNSFYYFTEDAQLYTDAQCTTPATQQNWSFGQEAYYKLEYFVLNEGGSAEQKTEYVRIPAGSTEFDHLVNTSEGVGIAKGTQKTNRIKDLVADKTENVTGTASGYLSPDWSATPGFITTSLGNNGKLTVDIPGSLEVTKKVESAEGVTAPENASFPFTVNLTNADGEYGAQVYGENGDPVGPAFTIKNGSTFTLKADETLKVVGLPAGASYIVTENTDAETMPQGFEQTASDGATGTIVAGEASKASFTNKYSVKEFALSGSEYLDGAKVLTPRDWLESDSFTFVLAGSYIPDGYQTEITVKSGTAKADEQVKFNFEDITFTKPGTYTYTIQERAPQGEDRIPGMSYSGAVYRITINLTDKGDGTMASDIKVEQTNLDSGAQMEQPILAELAVFTNTFNTEVNNWAPQASKVYTDDSGANPLTANMFHFRLKAVGDNASEAPMPEDVTPEADGSVILGNLASDTQQARILIPDIQLTAAMVGQTYTYEMVEVVDVNGAWKPVSEAITTTDGEYIENGMTYDGTAHTVKVTVTVNDEGVISPVVVYDDNATQIEFTNSYETESLTLTGDAAIHGTKTLAGRDMQEGEAFNFTLVGADDTTKAALESGVVSFDDQTGEGVTASVSGGKKDEVVAFDFGNITITKPGTYVFDVTETAGDKKGVAYDGHTSKVTIEVTDPNKDGKLAADVTYSDGDRCIFTNKYEAKATYGEQGALTVAKTLTGRDMNAGEFTFTITGGDEAHAVPAVDAKFTNDKGAVDGMASEMTGKLGSLTFTQEDIGKTFTYTVKEKVPAEGEETFGITYDKSEHTVAITVEDNGDGTLKLVTEVDGTEGNVVAFKNSYATEPVTMPAEDGFAGFKQFTGREWKTGEGGDSFTFKVESVSAPAGVDAPMPNPGTVTVSEPTYEDGTIAPFNFGDLTFDTVGEYVYRVSEVVPGDLGEDGRLNGIKYDTHTATYTVTVSDNGDGTLRVKVETTGNTMWTNTYEAGANEGVTWTGDLTKVFTGKNWDGEEFEFTISSVTEGAPMPTGGNTVKVSGPDEEGGNTATFNFGDITFNEAGTYVYEVTEAKGGLGGVTYSTNKATVTVTVTDKDASGAATGKLVATATVENGTFTNTYQSKLDYVGAGGLQLTKTLNGRDMADGQFEFTVKSTGDEDRLGIDGKTFKSPAAKAGVEGAPVKLITGETVEFTSDDAGKKFSYEIVETKKGEAGYTNDEATHKVDIEVTDNGDGTLKVTTTVDGTPYEYATDGAAMQVPTVKFVNSYDAGTATLGGEGEVSINATKSLTNRPMTDGEFTFEVKNADTVVATGTNDANGNITFGAIKYDLDKLRADVESGVAQKASADGVDTYTYHYTVAEKTDGLDAAGVTPVESSFEIGVVVTDDNTGALKVEVVYPEGTTSLDFENTYGTSASREFHAQGKKVLNAADGLTPPDIENKFAFTISGVDEDGNEAPLPEKTEATNDATGNVDFGKIEFTMQNVFGDTGSVAADADGEGSVQTMFAQRTKTFTYTVTESGDVAGVTNDLEASKTFEVAVTDNGDGTISVSGPTSAAFTFVNTYAVGPVTFDPTGEGALSIGKTLTGRDMSEGEFSFELVETVDGAEAVVSTGTAAAAADGEAATVSFAPITYTEPGEHTYTLREVKGEAGGVDYDSREYTVKASVVDNGDGTLSVKMGFDGAEAATFENAYAADPTSVSLQAAKVLEGADLADGQFTFQMLDREGKVFREARNDAEGAVAFPAIEFTEAGTYTYAVVEKNDGQEGVTYDDARYEVVVTVADDGEGNLAAAVESNAGEEGLVFENAYAAPADPEPAPLPPADDGDGATLVKTGDAAPTAPLVGGALAAAAALALAGRKLVRVPLRRDR
ncbi:T surface-antigen of pili [Coriobacteriaceae bacterium CHKCI002]|nr:T surface-antigen of pili [Coriobacteriaceae bacterium CHKCI002]